MEERDEKILRHVGLYYISLRPTLEKLFFNGNKTACGNVITRLTKSKLLVARPRAFPGNLSYYQISESEAKRLNIPEYRAKAPAGQALPEKLATLWFCCMLGKRRTRIEKNKIEEVFGVQPFSGPHCHEKDEQTGQRRILRIFPPNADDDYLIRNIRQHIDLVTERGCLDWLKTGAYGVAALIETEARKRKLEREIQEKVPSKISFTVDVVPTPNSLKEAINAIQPDAASAD
jgi:hypothetical protein